MADSMCGPSNALQNFQKHSTVDRTLQQDRIVSRQSPSQGFRSSPGADAGFLDQDFEAFQQGQLPLDLTLQRHNPQAGLQSPGPSGWASDFQRLNIGSPLPGPQYQQRQYTPQVQQRLDTGGWHQDFARQQSGEQRMGQTPVQMNTPFRYTPSGMSGMSMGSGYSGGFMGQQPEMAQQQQPVETYDDEAFARAFQEAEAHEAEARQAASEAQDQNVEMGQDIMINESAERLMATETGLLDQVRIGADTIQDPLTQDPQTRAEENNPDALARTAGQLLDSVRHDQSSKFQNSQFLMLMRQFRDKEATVDGDRIVGAGDQGMGSEFAAAQ